MSEVVRAAGLLVYRTRNNVNEYLMLQASYKPYHWTPPKGHVEEEEDEWAAALRETTEEAGIDPSKSLEIYKDFCHVMQYSANGKPKKVTFWLARLKSADGSLPEADVKLSMEHQKSAWADVNEAIRIGRYPEIEKMLLEAEEYIKNKAQ